MLYHGNFFIFRIGIKENHSLLFLFNRSYRITTFLNNWIEPKMNTLLNVNSS